MTKRKPTVFDLMIITGISLVLFAIPMGVLFAFESRQAFQGDWRWQVISGVIMTMALVLIGIVFFWDRQNGSETTLESNGQVNT